jgi:hypothetical protein
MTEASGYVSPFNEDVTAICSRYFPAACRGCPIYTQCMRVGATAIATAEHGEALKRINEHATLCRKEAE